MERRQSDILALNFVRYTPSMLFMVIERFKQGDPGPVGERFKVCGRMLPEGVTYQASWIGGTGSRCFQIMEAPSLAALSVWVSRWDDIIDFEIASVLSSADFWARLNSSPS
jgi:Protein of unknown function (DUF3303)